MRFLTNLLHYQLIFSLGHCLGVLRGTRIFNLFGEGNPKLLSPTPTFKGNAVLKQLWSCFLSFQFHL